MRASDINTQPSRADGKLSGGISEIKIGGFESGYLHSASMELDGVLYIFEPPVFEWNDTARRFIIIDKEDDQ